MAVEIKELVIRATLTENPEQSAVPQAGSRQDTRELVAACVEEVMNILRREKER